MSDVKVIVYVEPDAIGMNLFEVHEMAVTIADAYPRNGKYVASFGFLNYAVTRTDEKCVVEVTEGGGFHNAWGDPVIHLC